MAKNYYKCECGKEFYTPNSFNGHKSNCKIRYELLGKLDEYNEIKKKRGKSISESRKNSNNKRKLLIKYGKFECVCGKCFNNVFSLSAHKGSCIKYHELIGKPIKQYANFSYDVKERMRHKGLGEYGRGYQGWKYGIFCQSRYELAYVIYNKENNIDIVRNKDYWYYTYKGQTHRYFPDFRVNGKLIEIKGLKTELVDIKLKAVDEDIDILYKDDLKYCFDYCKDKYGLKINQLQQLFDKK